MSPYSEWANYVRAQSYHNLLYRTANGFVWNQSYRIEILSGVFLPNFILIMELFWNGFDKDGTNSECNLNSIGKKTDMMNFSNSCTFHRAPSRKYRASIRFWTDTAEYVTPHTIVIRLDKISWVSRLLQDAPNSRMCSADLYYPYDYERIIQYSDNDGY